MKNKLLTMSPIGRKLILGTDWHVDVDDAVAVRLIAWAHLQGKIQLLGISIDSAMEYSVSSLNAFLENEGIGEVPIGLDKDAFDYGGEGKYQKRLAEGRDIEAENARAEQALKLYRRLLASADGKVDIIEIGFNQVLASLLASGADEYSPLDGAELVRQKVGTVWIMGGEWKGMGKREFNFAVKPKATAAIRNFTENCPVEIVFLGYEIGVDVITGKPLIERYPDDKLSMCLCDYGAANGRRSWDPMTAYMACVGDAEECGYRLVRGKATIDETGITTLARDENGKHAYVERLYPAEEYAECINEILLLQAECVKK